MEVLLNISAQINPAIWVQLSHEDRNYLLNPVDSSSFENDLGLVISYHGNDCIEVSGKWLRMKDLFDKLDYISKCITNCYSVPNLVQLGPGLCDASIQTDTPPFSNVDNDKNELLDQIYNRELMIESPEDETIEVGQEFTGNNTVIHTHELPSSCLHPFESPTNSDDVNDLISSEQNVQCLKGPNVCDNGDLHIPDSGNFAQALCDNLVSQAGTQGLSCNETFTDSCNVHEDAVDKLLMGNGVSPCEDFHSSANESVLENTENNLHVREDRAPLDHFVERLLRNHKSERSHEKDEQLEEVIEAPNEINTVSTSSKKDGPKSKKKKRKAKISGTKFKKLLRKCNKPQTNELLTNDEEIAENQTKVTSKTQGDKSSATKAKASKIPKKRGRKPKLRNPNELISCKYCSYTTKVQARLLVHMTRQHEERKYPCHICDKSFGTRSDQKRHILGHSASYICDVCGKVYKSQRFVEQHRMKHHEGFVKPEFPCEICNKVFTAKCSLKQHIEFIHKGNRQTYLCRFCGRSFTQKRHMIEHENKHTGRKPFICKVCGAPFHHSSSLRSHEVVHIDKTDFPCDSCDKAFRTKHALASHKLTHAGPGRFRCDICEKMFTQKQAMLRHLRIHTGERPYTCYLCSDKFSDRSVLRRHLIGVHKLSLDKLPKGSRRRFTTDLEALKEGNPGPGLADALEAAAMSLQGCDFSDGVVPPMPEQSALDHHDHVDSVMNSEIMQPEQVVETTDHLEPLQAELSSISNQQLISDPIYSHAMSFDVAVAQMHDLNSQASVQSMVLPSGQSVLDYNHVMTAHHLAGHGLTDQVSHHQLDHHHVHDVADHHLGDHQITDHMTEAQVADHHNHMVDHQLTDGQMADHHMTDHDHHMTDHEHHMTDHEHHMTDHDHHMTDHDHHMTDHHLADHQLTEHHMEQQLTAEQLAEHQLGEHSMGDHQVSDPHLSAQALSSQHGHAQQLEHGIHPVSTTSLVPDPVYTQAIPGTLVGPVGATAQDLAGLPEPPPAHRHLATAHYFNGLVNDPQNLPLHQSVLPHMSYLTQPPDPSNPVSSYGALLDAHAQHLHNLHGYGTL